MTDNLRPASWAARGLYGGPYQHTKHPEWEIHANNVTGGSRFVLLNTVTGAMVPLGMPTLYPAMDAAAEYIRTIGTRHGDPQR
ncbi:hypothetical protein JNW90_01220 [Micromonospora sp. STR1s_5]|nr:hypothetical protein [Micromonospora sp. STR1s_5]